MATEESKFFHFVFIWETISVTQRKDHHEREQPTFASCRGENNQPINDEFCVLVVVVYWFLVL